MRALYTLIFVLFSRCLLYHMCLYSLPNALYLLYLFVVNFLVDLICRSIPASWPDGSPSVQWWNEDSSTLLDEEAGSVVGKAEVSNQMFSMSL